MADGRRQHDLRHLKFHGAPAAGPRARGAEGVFPSIQAASRLPSSRTQAIVEWPETAIDGFIVWLLRQAGLDAMRYRASPLQRRLPACLRALRATSADQARTLIEQRPRLLTVALGSLLLGVTEFYRDPQVFAALAELLPSLPVDPAKATGSRPGGLGLKVWSVACSDGCEVYSIAILLAELGLLEDSYLLGTDCREEAVVAARCGVYAEASLKQLSASHRERYFATEGVGYRVADRLRRRVHFEVKDLFRPGESGPWDLILWRNTAIYLRATAARAVWQRLGAALRPGGLLVTGKAERPDCRIPLKRVDGCIYRKEMC